jgi:hypothetical protein
MKYNQAEFLLFNSQKPMNFIDSVCFLLLNIFFPQNKFAS